MAASEPSHHQRKCLKTFSSLTGAPEDEIRNMANNISFNALKVDQIKTILRHYKDVKGYSGIHISANKPALVVQVTEIYEGRLGRKKKYTSSSSSSGFNPQHAHKGNKTTAHDDDSHYSNESVNVLMSAAENRSLQSMKRREVCAPWSVDRCISQYESRIIDFNAQDSILATSTSSNGADLVSREAQPENVLDSIYKQQVYRVLQQQGIPSSEILSAMAAVGDDDELDPDMLLLNIVIQRTEAEQRLREVAHRSALRWTEEEIEQYDRAVLESERERDVIQERKRQRLSDLYRPGISLFSVEEYCKSFFLYGMQKGCFPGEAASVQGLSAATTSSSAGLEIVDLVSDDDEPSSSISNESHCTPALPGSSTCFLTARLIDAMDDWHSNDAKKDSVSNNETLLRQHASELRCALSQLLLAEANARKFFSNFATSYILYRSLILDSNVLYCEPCVKKFAQLSSVWDAVIRMECSDFSGALHEYDGTLRVPDCDRSIDIATTISRIKHEARRLSKGIARLPEDGSQLPIIFRRVSIEQSIRNLVPQKLWVLLPLQSPQDSASNCIETDGFELVNCSNSSKNATQLEGNSDSDTATEIYDSDEFDDHEE